MPSATKQCYNRGCGQKYDLACNTKDSCKFHSGTPVFHDAYKGWSCCGKKTTDFTEFLNTPGCTLGYHSDVRPEELTSSSSSSSGGPRLLKIETAVLEENCKSIEPLSPPDTDAPMTLLKSWVSPSLTKQLQQKPVEDAATTPDISPTCLNHGCSERQGSDKPECTFHSGAPVFHEGMKYWSCCQRKTSDFTAFLNQQGCQLGPHQWTKPKKSDSPTSSGGQRLCYDWHQTASDVYLVLYVRCPDPAHCEVQVGPGRVLLSVGAADGSKLELDRLLYQAVDPAASTLQMFPTKLEVKMKKMQLISWPQPFSTSTSTTTTIEPDEAEQKRDEGKDAEVSRRVDAIDLSDL